MSWDASLIDDRGHIEGEWNYTHNTNGMANLALDENYEQRSTHISWWKQLDGLSGPEGAALLDRIIRTMQRTPDVFVALNPDNGWGDYDRFLKKLVEMRAAVPGWPTKWSVRG